MNERHLINNIVIKYFVGKRYSKCMYKRRDDPDGGLLRLYKFAKWYKELKAVDSYYDRSNERLYVTYTSDKDMKVSHVKQRIIKQKVLKNFTMVFYGCLVLLVVLSCIACLLVYNNNKHVECTLPYGDCPVILHKGVDNFFINVRMHELSKDRILEAYLAMKNAQRSRFSKSEGKGNIFHGEADGIKLKKKKKYSLLSTNNVKCKECKVVFHLEGKETHEDIFHFEDVNKCKKTIRRENCVHVKDGTMWNNRIHLYKRYSGPIKNMDTLGRGAAREKVVLDDRVMFLHPSLKDYVLNLDYFTLRSEAGKRIPVNEEPLRGGRNLKEKNQHICHPDYRKTFWNNTFYWLCPQFYEEDRGSREYTIALSIMQMVNMQGSGEADENKHLLEMGKLSATPRRYDHFGFIEHKLELPLKVDIFSRFQPHDVETENMDMLEKIYRVFFCQGPRGSPSEGKKPHPYSHSGASHEDGRSRRKFSFSNDEGEQKETRGMLHGTGVMDTYNDVEKENTSIHMDNTSMTDEEEYLSMEDICREDKYPEVENMADVKESSTKEGKGYNRKVHIKEIPTFEKNKRKEKETKGLNKELVIISPSLFFGIMDRTLDVVFFLLVLLLGMILVMVAIYICLTIGHDVSVILKDQADIEEMPRYLKRISKQITGGGDCISVGGSDGGYFRIQRRASDPF
ncbi:conserved Plasmodium protein, unknown function [Plasmodium knowlesi strain H]|uniref:Uncharacterized protein n=3 Tax=Plasmodium knowlesi TaxID=5850 RepID=A0A5K1TWD5_PLAKH|nr:conserved Plasmodium protein, unknown function [Plasmodium knowlesi strain H]OTN67264.1 Uncharacterized protein PKNOH_S06433900 [Plasmodium knowlesi]CAA9987609.1 conserved Plasmodium protein, unknown function [Plasmodium knowlesi strain H]SBO26993.1 conserved Plasmodium protein, unknown function [Plasmodium knowlesi strain H]SBO29246.1 conserved Plasmodium protein, unknown function [Plasmodium knowlesi strain H]VVS77083.1 conserved Plasmodium protein, unknown function [Plasmodium knowlesi s|eukprot:XP_002258610.1 hypothetical protein, conserved in Plasmodium species [Plasmodium knowlesi strain H]